MKYAIFIVIDPEPTEEDDAASPTIDGWFDFMLDKGAYLVGS